MSLFPLRLEFISTSRQGLYVFMPWPGREQNGKLNCCTKLRRPQIKGFFPVSGLGFNLPAHSSRCRSEMSSFTSLISKCLELVVITCITSVLVWMINFLNFCLRKIFALFYPLSFTDTLLLLHREINHCYEWNLSFNHEWFHVFGAFSGCHLHCYVFAFLLNGLTLICAKLKFKDPVPGRDRWDVRSCHLHTSKRELYSS